MQAYPFDNTTCSQINILDSVYLRIAPDQYHYLKFILEGYDNLAILSCVDRKLGLVVIRYPNERAHEIFTLLASMVSRLLTGKKSQKQEGSATT